jgi:tetratricopeptide (TPR) repeat protein
MKHLNQADPAYIEAMTQYMAGDWHEAEVSFRNLHQAYPQSTFVLLNLGQVYYSLGQLDNSIDTYKKALEINPELGIGYYRLGVCYFRAGRLLKALEAFKRVTDSPNQSHAMASYFVGLISFFLGEDSNAAQSFSAFRQVSKESMIANFFLAQLKLKHHAYQEALDLLQELAIETPKFSEVHYMMAQAHYGLHENTEAIRCLRKVLELNPGDERAKTKLTLMTDMDF